MKDEHILESDSQLNIDALSSVEPDGEQYSLEDIMREFGGWSKPAPEPEPELKPVPDPAPEPVSPVSEPASSVMRVAAESEKAEKPAFRLVDLSGDTIPFKAVTEEQLQDAAAVEKSTPVEMPEEPEQALSQKQRQRQQRQVKKLRHQEQKRLRQARRTERREARIRRRNAPELVYPSPEEACAAYAKGGTLRLRLLLCLLLTLASCVLLYLSEYPVASIDLTAHGRPISIAMLAMLLVQCLCSAEVLLRGIYQMIRLRFDLMSMLTVATALCFADAFFAISDMRTPLCAPPALALLLALWSVSLEKRAKWRTLKTVLSMDAPVAAVKEEKAWHDLDCIFRQEGNLEDFTSMLETPDAAQKVMRVYAPAAMVVTLGLAVFAAVHGASSFLWSWSVLLLASLPAGGFLACYRPFAILAGRLHKAGAAVCGWRGAKLLSGECGLVIRDDDLFPKASITMNGMKMYSDLPTRHVIGYATAVVQAAGSGLLPLFEEVMKNENGRRFTADTFRQYEGGGLGAEIRGDVVLLGSLPFMRLMGIHVPEGTRVQSAVYISVNGELAGVFALTYTPSASGKTALQNVVHAPGLTPILATRDFMITPALVKKRFKVSADRLEFPMVAERVRLSADSAGSKGTQGALMARGSFASFAAAATGSRLLRRTVHSAVAVCLLSGIIGTLLLCVMTYLGAIAAASALNLLLYQLLWLLPLMLITGLIGKS